MTNTDADSNKKGQGPKPARADVSRASDADIQQAHDTLLAQKEAPATGFSVVPIAFIFLTSAVILITAIYMVWNSDDFDPLGYDDTRRRFAWEAEEADDVDPAEQVIRVGMQIYNTNCAVCHQPEGQGMPGAFPPLAGNETVLEQEQRLIRVVMHGMTGPVEVMGEQYNGVMPDLGLNDEQIAAVLTYVRQAWENDAEPISAADVQEVREQTSGRAQPWTDDELQEFED